MFRRICHLAVSFYIVSQLFAIATHQRSQASSQQPPRTPVDCSLIDWHVSGFWIINSPVAWIRVTNNTDRLLKHVTVKYETFGEDGKVLDDGTYTMEGAVAPHATKNFIEQYMGLISLESQTLRVTFVSTEE